MTVDDATLLAYADGLLAPDEARAVEASVARDGALADRLRLMRDSGSAVRGAYAHAFAAPVPNRMAATLRRGSPRASWRASSWRTSSWRASSGGPWSWRRWLPVAAASVCALAVGLFVGGEPPGREGVVRLASAGNASTLDDATALALIMALEGSAPMPGAPHVTVLGDVDAGLDVPCRRFAIGAATTVPGAASRGLACQGADGAWSLLVLPAVSP